MHYLANFFAGAFLCNCIPHLAAGLQGLPFPTPFATPRGVGNSSPFINVLWGFFNTLAGLCLLASFPVKVSFSADFLLVLAGALALGVYLSLHFGKVRGGE
ncbi:hypothetical protein ACO0LO_18140 [Undibacterium sp. TJN25]|uniref:hypothetical protein n=1 Tax=Undibacterium sp. TJN25 TaxID=3413056 RepID=UPI003BF005DF